MENNLERTRRVESILRKETDLVRWSDSKNLEISWEPRSKVIANYIPAGSCILDLGCGSSLIEKYLDISCKYIPADLVSRDQRTIFCNLNEEVFPLDIVSADIILMLGVVEYIFDVPSLFSRLSKLNKKIIFSYCDTDTSNLRSFEERAAFGWVNAYSCDEIEALILKYHPLSISSFEIDNLQRGYIAVF